MDLRMKFNEDEVNYDLLRPRYCHELFSKILAYSGVDNKSKLIEVGIGTGQATEPFLKQGCCVTAIEIGDKLAAYSSRKFSKFENFKVLNIGFEELKYKFSSTDLLYSATAFHWIPSEVGYPQAFNMLKAGGTIALFWNRPSLGDTKDDIVVEIQKVYEKYGFPPLLDPSEVEDKYKRRKQNLIDNRFVDVEFSLFDSTRLLTSEAYISLLNTYSDHRSLSSEIKAGFEREICETINRFGGKLLIYDTIDLYLGRKPV